MLLCCFYRFVCVDCCDYFWVYCGFWIVIFGVWLLFFWGLGFCLFWYFVGPVVLLFAVCFDWFPFVGFDG